MRIKEEFETTYDPTISEAAQSPFCDLPNRYWSTLDTLLEVVESCRSRLGRFPEHWAEITAEGDFWVGETALLLAASIEVGTTRRLRDQRA